MSNPARTLAIFVVLLVAAGSDVLPRRAIAQVANLAPQEGIVVLTNQNILRGKISLSGGYYYIASEGSEIRIRAEQVEMACANLDEAFQRKRQALPAGNIERQIELAGWCIKHGLIGYAAGQVLEIRQQDIGNPYLPMLERRLALASAPRPVADSAETAGDTSEVNRPTLEMLDQLLKETPREIVADFTAHIQPLIVSRCGLAGCHGPNPTSNFQLERLPIRQSYGSRLTQRNLYAVLQQIDKNSPEASTLLQWARKAHGDNRRPIFTSQEEEQLRRLTEWVYTIRQSPANLAPQTVVLSAGSSPLLQTVPQSPGTVTTPFPNQAPEQTPVSWPTAPRLLETPSLQTDGPIAAQSLPAESTPPGTPPAASESQAIGYIMRDPFDPEYFNRLYVTPQRPTGMGIAPLPK